jgi:lambda family phage portal protein
VAGLGKRVLGWLDNFTGADKRSKRRLVNGIAETGSFRRAERLAERLGVDPPDESLRRWDAAKTTRLNKGHWTPVNGQPINAELSAWHSTLRQRSEFEVANNALVEGMIQTYQLCVVGSEGPRLSILTEDREYAAARRALWSEWSQSAGSNQQLSLVEILDQWIRSLFAGGEFFNQLVTVPDAPGPLKTRLLPIHTHRLATPPQMMGDASIALGVKRDLKNRRPVSYFVSEPSVFGAYELYNGLYLEIPYEDALHGFKLIEEDQVRGVPWLASCLDAVAELRDFKIETLDAARAAADFAVLLSTQHNDAPYIQTNETTDIERRTIRNLPPGWQASMVAPQHPGPQYDTFYESLAREIGGPICMPLMMLLLDSSSHNYSSARFDGQMYWRGVAKTQGWLARLLLRVESILALEAELAGVLPPPPSDLVRRMIWPLAPHVDPTKEATAERMYLENGTLTYSEACAARGKSVEEVIAERQNDNEKLEAAGLPLVATPQTGGQMPQDNQDGQDFGDKKQQQDKQRSELPTEIKVAPHIEINVAEKSVLDSVVKTVESLNGRLDDTGLFAASEVESLRQSVDLLKTRLASEDSERESMNSDFVAALNNIAEILKRERVINVPAPQVTLAAPQAKPDANLPLLKDAVDELTAAIKREVKINRDQDGLITGLKRT